MLRADKFKKLSPTEHVLAAPVMYVGSVKRILRKEWHLIKNKVINHDTDIPVAMVHLFKEAISNVADNAQKSRENGVSPGECFIEIKGNLVLIKNGGLSIEIVKNSEGVYIPETIFSDMLSGSNFVEERTAGGAHGIGIKAVNILSKEFTLLVENAVQHKSYQQTWTNNNKAKTKPIITDYKGKESFVTISYTIDHQRFGYDKPIFRYPDSAIQIFHWIAASLSFTSMIPVTFNNQYFQYTIGSYAKLYLGEQTLKKHFIYCDDKVQLIVIDTPNKGKQIGFSNSIINADGGIHVTTPISIIKKHFIVKKDNKKDNKTKDNKKEIDEPKITVRDLKPHLTVIISVNGIINPEYDSGQTKAIFKGPMPKLNISIEELNKIKSWSLPSMLNASANAKTLKAIMDNNKVPTKGKYMFTKRGEDATHAGTKDSHLCKLYAVEGDSAEGYLAELLDFLPGGRKYTGTLLLRGKPLNVLKHNDENILKNEEIQEIIRRLGAQINVDYNIEKNVKSLRYGGFIIMTDADIDGTHIKALLLAVFRKFFPTLLECGFVFDYMTPIVRATKGKIVRKFYFDKELIDWEKRTKDLHTWKYEYFKGLGSSQRQHVKEDKEANKVIKMICDEEAFDKLDVAMIGGDYIQAKQKWIKEWNPECVEVIRNNELMISKFVNQFLRNYSHHTLSRHLPSCKDGLTVVQRKIIFGAFKKWGRKCTSSKWVRVPEFGGTVTNKMMYHHGEAAIHSSIIAMARDFVGSNNLPLLVGKGRFGSLEKGGKHAAQPRYLFVSPSPLLPYIFRPEDDDALIILKDEGQDIEPIHILPIIPMETLNGVDGIATGWRAILPNYHPVEIIDAYINRLKELSFIELIPWYRDYPGEMFLDDGAFVSRGVVTEATENSYTLTCLPVGMWNNKYKKRLLEAVLNGTIKDYEANCSATRTYFKVTGMEVFDENNCKRPLMEKDIGIERRMPLNNITLLNGDGLPITYSNIVELLEDFYQYRLPYYQKRKDYLLGDIKKEIKKIEDRIKYIREVVAGNLVFMIGKAALPKEQILERIKELELCEGFYKKTEGYSIVKPNEYPSETITKYKNDINEMEKKYEEINKINPKEMWITDLIELKKEYRKIYPNDDRVIYI